MQESLDHIREAVQTLAKKEKRTNGYQTLLWLLQAIVLPGLGFCAFHVIQMSGNRFTSMDAANWQTAHQELHSSLTSQITTMSAKLSSLPPSQISENEADIKELRRLLREHERAHTKQPN